MNSKEKVVVAAVAVVVIIVMAAGDIGIKNIVMIFIKF